MDELMIRDFVDALLNGRPVPVTGEDGLKSAVVATNRGWFKVDLRGIHPMVVPNVPV